MDTTPTDTSRRAVLQKAALGAGLVWTAPILLSAPVAAQGTPVPCECGDVLAGAGDGSLSGWTVTPTATPAYIQSVNSGFAPLPTGAAYPIYASPALVQGAGGAVLRTMSRTVPVNSSACIGQTFTFSGFVFSTSKGYVELVLEFLNGSGAVLQTFTARQTFNGWGTTAVGAAGAAPAGTTDIRVSVRFVWQNLNGQPGDQAVDALTLSTCTSP
jgi:hypothetical protein